MISMDTISVLHYYFTMKNVTIRLDEEVARWARNYLAYSDREALHDREGLR